MTLRSQRLMRLCVELVLLTAACSSLAIAFMSAVRGGPLNDFEMLYGSGRAVLTGHDWYFYSNWIGTHNLNSPPAVLLLAPLALLPIRAALVLWLVVGVVAIVAASALIAREVAPGFGMLIGSAIVASGAGFANLGAGQIAWPLVWAATVAWVETRRGHVRTGGFVAGVLMTVKPFFLVFVPYFVVRRQWRPLAAALASGAIASMMAFLVGGVGAYQSWLASLRTAPSYSHFLNASVMALVTRALSGEASTFVPMRVAPFLIFPVWVVAVAALVGVAAWRFWRTPDLDGEWSAVLLIALLASPIGWLYYVTTAAGPITAIARRSRYAASIVTSGVALLTMPYVLVFGAARTAIGTLTIGSAFFWGVALLFCSAVGAAWNTRAPSAIDAAID